MRLRTQFGVGLVVVTLLLLATTLVGFTLYRDAIVARERSELERTSQGVATQLNVVLDEREQAVQLWARNPALRSPDRDERMAALRSFVRATSFNGASVVDGNGTMTALYSNSLTPAEQRRLVGQSFAGRTYVRRALAGETYVSDPVAAESGYRIVTVSTPIRVDGRVVATFNGAFHLSESDTFGSIRAVTGPSQRVRVVADGSTVYAVGANVTGGGLVANATMPETGWHVSVTQSSAVVQSRLETVTLLQAGAFVFVLGSLAGFGAWLYREFVGNVERLRAGFDALVDGEYGTTVSLSGGAEWSAVRDGFNELSETLDRRQTEVTVLNRVLRHNLRNAMTVVLGNANNIAEATDDEEIERQAAAIHRRGDALLDLADHARAIDSSIQSSPTETPARSADAVLDDVETALREEFPDAELTVAADPDAAVPNADVLAVAIEELARNAVVHGEADPPSVDLTARADDGHVVVTVSDGGPGMPPLERRLLTESFVETSTEHGTGLGLWVVKWLVDWAGGDIDVAVDAGTTVTVTLPGAAES